MRGTSRASLAAAKRRLAAALGDGEGPLQASALGDELFAVTALLDSEPALRRALSDPSRDGAARAGLAESVLRGKLSEIALDQLTSLVADRWSEASDLADACEQLAVFAFAVSADRAGQLDETEDELFRFGRIAAGNPDLRSALSNWFAPVAARTELVSTLRTGKVSAAALRLITQAAAQPRGRSLDASLEQYARLAAQLREQLLAVVRVAAPLSAERRARLAAALSAAYGHDVHLNVVLDPEVIGGLSVRIGDQLINGSVAARLAELRRGLAA
jgi:F-type H+-transporting ATPase subunit delta